MKKSLQEKLKAYSAVAGSVAATSAGAQIVYTDVNPDFVAHDSVIYVLDLNNDLTPDFGFAADTAMNGVVVTAYAVAVALDSNQILGSNYSFYSYNIPQPYALNNGDSIKPSSVTWLDSNYTYLGVIYPPFVLGNWVGATDKYLGLRVKAGGQYYYGWARLTVPMTSDSIIVKDYAFESTPNIRKRSQTAGRRHDLGV
jgi:hypothetical protein